MQFFNMHYISKMLIKNILKKRLFQNSIDNNIYSLIQTKIYDILIKLKTNKKHEEHKLFGSTEHFYVIYRLDNS